MHFGSRVLAQASRVAQRARSPSGVRPPRLPTPRRGWTAPEAPRLLGLLSVGIFASAHPLAEAPRA